MIQHTTSEKLSPISSCQHAGTGNLRPSDTPLPASALPSISIFQHVPKSLDATCTIATSGPVSRGKQGTISDCAKDEKREDSTILNRSELDIAPERVLSLRTDSTK